MGSKTVDHFGIQSIHLSITHHKHSQLGHQSLLFAMLRSIFYKQHALLQNAKNRDHSDINNKNVEKLLEKSKNILQEDRENS